MYSYKVIKKYNLIIVKWIFREGDDFAEEYQDVVEKVYLDPDYSDGMDIVSDFRKAVLPKSQLYYNNMTKQIKVQGSGNTAVRLLNRSQIDYKQLLDIFHIFYKGNKFFNKIKTVYSVSEAFEALGLSEHEEELKVFFE